LLDATDFRIKQCGKFPQMVFLAIRTLHCVGTIGDRNNDIRHQSAPAVAVEHSTNARHGCVNFADCRFIRVYQFRRFLTHQVKLRGDLRAVAAQRVNFASDLLYIRHVRP
jgi:hypothetical protein